MPDKYSTRMMILKLRMLRINAGLSCDELASKVGLSGPTIRAMEEGQLPRPSTAKKVADYFGTTPTDLWPQLIEDRDDKVPA